MIFKMYTNTSTKFSIPFFYKEFPNLDVSPFMSQCIEKQEMIKSLIFERTQLAREKLNCIKRRKILIKKVQNVLKCQKKITVSFKVLLSMGALSSSCPSWCRGGS